jgi:hydrogenase expression/formation protein HypE
VTGPSCPLPSPGLPDRIRLAEGSGGRAMRALIEGLLVGEDPPLPPGSVGPSAMDDGAAIPFGDRFLVLTTDGHVVQPMFFPGGDIGRLAVCGTVNDLAVMGATEVIGLTCALIIEEGTPLDDLRRVQASIQATAREASAPVLTGDTKVMRRGELDGLVLVTTGVGLARRVIRDAGLQPGDRIVVTGTIGDHGLAVLAARNGLRSELRSGGDAVVAMKDPTRGGVAAALHEMATKAGVGIELDEAAVPVRDAVRAASELLGIDPLIVANEGKALIGVRGDAVDRVLDALRKHPLGVDAAVVAVATEANPGRVVVDTGFGRRLLVEPEGELLPRIC